MSSPFVIKNLSLGVNISLAERSAPNVPVLSPCSIYLILIFLYFSPTVIFILSCRCLTIINISSISIGSDSRILSIIVTPFIFSRVFGVSTVWGNNLVPFPQARIITFIFQY
jgi:hypothetical protein